VTEAANGRNAGSSVRSPLDLAAPFLARSDFLFAIALFGSLVGIGMCFLIKPHYVVDASFVPESGSENPALSLGGFGSLASRLGVGGLGAGSEADFYAQVIHSRTILDPVVTRRYNFSSEDGTSSSVSLLDILDVSDRETSERRLELASKELKERIDVSVDEASGIVSVSLDLPRADLGVAVIEAILAQLDSFNLFTRQSRAKNRREFLKDRVHHARLQLDSIETALEHFYAANRTFASSPSLSFEEARLRRRVNMAQEVYVTLNQQLEQAEIDAVRDTPTLTPVQQPIAPTEPKWPRMGIMAVIGALTGLLAGGVLTAWREIIPADSPIRTSVNNASAAIHEMIGRWRSPRRGRQR
jgi:uncharacterized protein involved in exopolysaccharide biosynthesis